MQGERGTCCRSFGSSAAKHINMDKHVPLTAAEFQIRFFQKLFQSWDFKQFLCLDTVYQRVCAHTVSFLEPVQKIREAVMQLLLYIFLLVSLNSTLIFFSVLCLNP